MAGILEDVHDLSTDLEPHPSADCAKWDLRVPRFHDFFYLRGVKSVSLADNSGPNTRYSK